MTYLWLIERSRVWKMRCEASPAAVRSMPAAEICVVRIAVLVAPDLFGHSQPIAAEYGSQLGSRHAARLQFGGKGRKLGR